MICTFFGHRNCPTTVARQLKNLLEELIIKNTKIKFYVGNNGNFDSIVYNTLKELKIKYPQILYFVILAYIPSKKEVAPMIYEGDTLIPDGIEIVPKKFAISYRNEWMINSSDMVVAYVNKSYGGAHKYLEIAKKKGKACINIFDTCSYLSDN